MDVLATSGATRALIGRAATTCDDETMVAAPASPCLAELRRFVRKHRQLFVLSGAGISTGSGIPAYRDTDARWQRSPPVMLRDFLASASTRRRYWAQSMKGWPIIDRAKPNAAHAALARLQAHGHARTLVTQNVDGLHQRAGSVGVIELHGNVRTVVCVECAALYSRRSVQDRLEAENRDFAAGTVTAAPDGDAAVAAGEFDHFVVPQCVRCAGVLKPSVVFFGEGVPRERVDRATQAMDDADAMLVVGSSLMVYSGYRFCERAAAANKPIAAVNLGRTRADHLFALKVEESCAAALESVIDE